MHFKAIVAAAILSAVVFGVASSHSVQAATNNQTPKPVVNTQKTEVKPKVVTVQPGDYLAKIAKANQTTYPRLYNANPEVKDPNLIYPGQKLKVPTADEKLANRGLGPISDAKISAPKAVSQPSASAAQPAPYHPPVSHYTLPANTSVWDSIAQCESGGNWSINTGNGFYGGLQFTLSSWRAVGGSGYPNQASKAEQIARAQILQSRQGWGAWPACSAKLGLR